MRLPLLLLVTAACSSDPDILASGDYQVDLRLIGATCATQPILIDGGFACPIGSFHAITPVEAGETPGELRCSDDPLDPRQMWNIEAETQNHSILGLVDTGRAFTLYTILTDPTELSGEADGAETGVRADGSSSDSLDNDGSWVADLEIESGDRFDGTLELYLSTLNGDSCDARYEITGTRVHD